ncbi:hypothetical protein SBV42_00380 [Chlamydia crocodili]|uniref:hypothetical protein n=1 Tax=Chlamydia crocodili TaxID=2766982 RepID=UPI003D4C32EB
MTKSTMEIRAEKTPPMMIRVGNVGKRIPAVIQAATPRQVIRMIRACAILTQRWGGGG